jgi:hypothetical protein
LEIDEWKKNQRQIMEMMDRPSKERCTEQRTRLWEGR